MLPVKVAKDPAPSRIGYRLQRLWLTPRFRWMCRRGVPLTIFAAAIWSVASHPAVQSWSTALYTDLRGQIAEHPELMITKVSVGGASPAVTTAINGALDLKVPVSSLDVSLPDLRHRIEALDAVKSADIRLVSGGVLDVRVTEREAAVVWRSGEGLQLLDEQGIRVASVSTRSTRADLPLLVGTGAGAHVDEALKLLRMAEPLQSRMRGLVRVGERRWDVILDRDQKIMLPEIGAEAALGRIMALHAAEDILNRDVVLVDMRDARRPILRLSDFAIDELRRLSATPEGEDA